MACYPHVSNQSPWPNLYNLRTTPLHQLTHLKTLNDHSHSTPKPCPPPASRPTSPRNGHCQAQAAQHGHQWSASTPSSSPSVSQPLTTYYCTYSRNRPHPPNPTIHQTDSQQPHPARQVLRQRRLLAAGVREIRSRAEQAAGSDL